MEPTDYMNPAYMAEMGDLAATPMDEPVQQKPQTNFQITEGEIRSMIMNRKQASETWRQAKQDIWDKCWKHYKQVYDNTNKENWQSTTFIPASPKVAEVIASNMHSALMAPEKPVEYQERDPEYAEQVRDANSLISVDFERSEFKVNWTDFLRTLCVTGTAIGKVEYVKEYADVQVKERVKQIPGMNMMRQILGLAPQPTETMVTKRMLVKDYASFRNVDPYDIFPQPGTTDISKDSWIIERGKIANFKLLELARDPESKLINITPDVLSTNPKDLNNDGSKQERDMALDEPVKTSAYLDPDQEHELLEYWGPAPIWMVQPELWGDESRKYEMVYAWFWLLDGVNVVRAQVTEWRDAEPPYVKGVYIRVPGQFWGIGPLELILGLQVELNELRNCRTDNVNLMLNKIIAVVKSAVASGEWGRLISGPGGVWIFDNIEDIKKAFTTVEFGDVTGDSWRSSQEVYNEIQEVTAAVKANMGTDGDMQGGSGTVRGQLMNRQAASERFIMYARILEITGLCKAIRKFYQRIYQYKGWKEAEQIVGPKRAAQFQFISPEELDAVAKLVPLGVTTMENKGVKLAQMRDTFLMLQGKPYFKEVDYARRMQEVAGDPPDQAIMNDEELQQLNEARRAMMGQMGGGLGPTGPNMGLELPGPGGPIAGDVPPPNDGMPQPSMPSRGPGASPIDVIGRPAA